MKDNLPSILPARPGQALLLVLLLFAVGLLAILPGYEGYFFGDEHFYTDSALQMRATGRYLTPTYADGSLRFNKPILPYWMIVAGFRVAGVSVLGSRLPSLLAGLVILLLTRRLTRRLFRSEGAGWIALLIMASNIGLMTASMRATPDVFLCLFTLAALTGYAGLLLDAPRPADPWLAYLGTGLAILSKGLLGALLPFFALAVAFSRPDRAARLRALWRPLPLLAGIATACSWFVAVFAIHGRQAVTGFFGDQVGDRIPSALGPILDNLQDYTVGLALPFFPWSLLLVLLLVTFRPALRRAWEAHRPAFRFCLSWYALLFAVFVFANLTRTRYLLPAYPLLAATLGALLAETASEWSQLRLVRPLLLAFVGLLLPAGALLLVPSFLNLPSVLLDKGSLLLAAGTLFLLAALLGFRLRKADSPISPAWIALTTFAVIWTAYAFIRPAVPSSPARAAVRVLASAGATCAFFPLQKEGMQERQLDFYKEKFASQIRLRSGGTLTVERLALKAYFARPSGVPMLCLESDAAHAPAGRFRTVRAGAALREDLNPADFWNAIRAPKPRKAFRALFVTYCVLFPEEAPSERLSP